MTTVAVAAAAAADDDYGDDDNHDDNDDDDGFNFFTLLLTVCVVFACPNVWWVVILRNTDGVLTVGNLSEATRRDGLCVSVDLLSVAWNLWNCFMRKLEN